MMRLNLVPASRLAEYAALPVDALRSYSTLAAEPPTLAQEDTPLPTGWSGVIGMEGVATGDGRLIENEALSWSTPIPLRFVKEDVGGHDGAVTVGRILSITRGEGGRIEAEGDFDLGSPEGREAARLVQGEILTGVSMDLDSVAFEVRIAKEVFDEMNAPLPVEIVEDGETADGEAPEPEEVDEEGRVTVAKLGADDEVMVTTEARIRAATLVSIPAFAEANISATVGETADRGESDGTSAEGDTLVASAAPVEPPQEWFMNPNLDGPTALTIDDNGRVYGHLATWDVCHIASPSGSGVCVMAPKSTSGYAYFHTGAVKTAEGTLVPTGPLTFATGHASTRANAADAAAHYDNTGHAGADVHVGEDAHGIWVAGALRPGLSEEQVRTLRASPLSGDWRQIGSSYELVGALSVNTPGFPIPRPQGLVASGEMTSLVAVGMIAPTPSPERSEALLASGLSERDMAYLARLVERERTREIRELRASVDEKVGRAKVAAMAAKLATGKAARAARKGN